MALSLDSIYKPLNDFFLTRFATGAGTSVQFRFDKFGSVIADSDFVDPAHPEDGYSANVAEEQFSDLVNHVPIDAGDGANIVLSASAIDETYFYRLVTPATPYVPDGTDQDTTSAILSTFGLLKKDAQSRWEETKFASSDGTMPGFRPSFPAPPSWYDKTQTGIWTTQSFNITDPTPPPPTGPPNQLWRLKLDDVAMQNVLTQAAPGVVVRDHRTLSPATHVAMAPAAARAAFSPAAHVAVATAPTHVVVEPQAGLAVRYAQIYRGLNVTDRLAVNQAVASSAPTRPATTNSIAISFDYCLVQISRPWMLDAFLQDRSWYVPGTVKGSLTSGTGGTGALTSLPIALVAIKNLAIQAQWTADDLAAAQNARDFGPFKVDAVVDNKVSHAGIQVIGWILQAMPSLPPNDPPA